MLWFYLLIGIAADTANVYVAKKLIETNNYWWLIGTVVTVVILNIAFILALKEGYVSIVTATWLVSVLVGSVALGYLFFNESLTAIQIIGITLAVISIILLQWPTPKSI